MKLTRNLAALSLALLFVANACSDDDSPGIKEPDPITPDLGVKVKASVSGFVSDEQNNPLPFVVINAGDQTASTDEYGYFEIEDASLPEVAGLVVATKQGYFSSYKTFLPKGNNGAFVRITMLGSGAAGNVEASAGGSMSFQDGTKVILPANGVMTASTEAAYTGTVNVSVRPLFSDADITPGDGRGTDSEGHLKALQSYGAIAVELTGSNSQLLQIASGKTAQISIPIPAELVATAPATITLWWFDPATGLWKEDGTATRNNAVYTAEVSHFSFWQGATGVPLVNFTARVVNTSSQPLANVPVTITIAGKPQGAGYSSFGYTNANGYVTGPVFANSNLVLDVVTPCALPAYSHEFTTTNTDIDLGTLTGNLGQTSVVLTGTVTNCNNQAVANGFVQTYDNGFYNRIPIVNGNFTFSGIMCTNTTVNLVVVDYATYAQNAPKTVTITPGNNALGTLQACGLSTRGKISYSLDNGPTVVIQEPTDTIGAYHVGGITQFVTISGEPNTAQKMAFQMTGGPNTTDSHTATEIFMNALPTGRGYWPTPIDIQITEFGKVGGFISGSFTTKIIAGIPDNNDSVHDLTCSFRVRRYK